MNEWSDFGGMLRSTREGHGWSLQDVTHRTRIPLATLRQLEENDYSQFASRAYTKSFLAQYSEHLGIEAADFLDTFQTDDAHANLDTYEYLKDHDEHVKASPLARSRTAPKKERSRPEQTMPHPAHTARTARQPLVVFSVTALLVSGAVFGFMKLSDSLSEHTEPTAEEQAGEETLAPLAGIPGSSAPRGVSAFDGIPRAIVVAPEDDLVAGAPLSTSGTENLNATPSSHKDPPVASSLDNPPPRAVIVEE